MVKAGSAKDQALERVEFHRGLSCDRKTSDYGGAEGWKIIGRTDFLYKWTDINKLKHEMNVFERNTFYVHP